MTWLRLYRATRDASAANARDTEEWAFIREIEKISWYELDGMDIEDFMNIARNSAGGRDLAPQHVKASLKDWEAPLSLRNKVARFFALRGIHPPVSAKT